MENVTTIVSQIQRYTDEPPEVVIGQLVGLWADWQSFVRSIVPESSDELPDRVEAIERKFNHLLYQTNQKCDQTLQRVAEGEQKTGAALQRIKDQLERLFGGLSERVVAAEKQLATITDPTTAPNLPTIAPAEISTKQIDLKALNVAQLRKMLTPNGLPQRLAPGSRYRNRAECLDVLGQLQDAGRLASTP